MRDKTVPSQLVSIILTIKYTYKANGYLKMYLIHGGQIKPLLALQRGWTPNLRTSSLAAGCSEMARAETAIQCDLAFLSSWSKIPEREEASLLQILEPLWREMSIQIRSPKPLLPAWRFSAGYPVWNRGNAHSLALAFFLCKITYHPACPHASHLPQRSVSQTQI